MPTHTQARELIENLHAEWRLGNLDGLLAQYTHDMVHWCNAGGLSGGPIEIFGQASFRETLAAVLRTTRCNSHVLTFAYDGTRATVKAHYRLEHRQTGVVLEGTYRQVVYFARGLISRLEEYHDAGRLTAFWQLAAEGAAPKVAVWDAEHPAKAEPLT